MSKRSFSLIALTLIASVFFTVVVHACSDLRFIHAGCKHPATTVRHKMNHAINRQRTTVTPFVTACLLYKLRLLIRNSPSSFDFASRSAVRCLSTARLSALFLAISGSSIFRAWGFAASFSHSSPHLSSSRSFSNRSLRLMLYLLRSSLSSSRAEASAIDYLE